MSKKQCIKALSLFQELNQEELDNVVTFSQKKFYQKGEFLFYEGDKVSKIFIINNGRIKLSKNSIEGKELTLGFASNDSVFGEEALFNDETYSMNGELIEDSWITICSKEDIEKLFLDNPMIAVKVIKSLSNKLNQSTNYVSDLAFETVRGRLLNTLKRLVDNYGQKTANGYLINLRLTHSDLASIINASRVTVTQTLSKLREEGIISITNHNILITNKKYLDDLP